MRDPCSAGNVLNLDLYVSMSVSWLLYYIVSIRCYYGKLGKGYMGTFCMIS